MTDRARVAGEASLVMDLLADVLSDAFASGILHCPCCGEQLPPDTYKQITDRIEHHDSTETLVAGDLLGRP